MGRTRKHVGRHGHASSSQASSLARIDRHERNAALQQKAATPPPRETKRYFKVRVRDAGTLEAGLLPTDTVLIRLEGIKARKADETCKKESGKSWPCGAKARAALTLFIRYRAVTCTVPPGGETRDFAARCSVMGQAPGLGDATRRRRA